MGLLFESQRLHWKGLTEKLKRLEGQSRKLAEQLKTSAQTALPNSEVLREELQKLLEGSPGAKAVVIVALDESFWKLKRYDVPSAVPDWILVQTKNRIEALVGPRSRIYHTHEHEFLIVMTAFRNPKEIETLAGQLVEAIREKFKLKNMYFSIGANLGIALYPDHARTKSNLLRNADMALSEAIRLRVPFLLFTPELRDRMIRTFEIQGELLKAIETQTENTSEGQFELYLQPQVEVRNWGLPEVQGRIIGAEALVRWKNPSRGFVSPGEFIPVAEETGMIHLLGKRILYRALSMLNELGALGFSHLSLSVNFSSKQVDAKDFDTSIIRLTKKNGIDPSLLKLEITESGLMDDLLQTIPKVAALQQAGFKILIDDFGTGYSSLSYLKDLPIDVVKVDKSFVDGLPDDPGDQALSRAIIVLARDLNKGIIVEGTENRRQIDWLYKQGCTVFQGYYFSKPIPFDEFLKLLDEFPRVFREKANDGSEPV